MPGMQDQETQICQELLVELRQMQYRYSQPATLLADHRSEDVREATTIWARKAERIGQVIDCAQREWGAADRRDALRTLGADPEATARAARDTEEMPRVH